MFWPATADPTRDSVAIFCARIVDIQVDPPFVDTKMLEDPWLATPTKMRGVGEPAVPEVESKVTHAIPVH